MLLKKELVVVGIDAKDADEALLAATQPFVDAGYAKTTFPQAVADRESVYATGLQAAGMDVAIPHAESAYVLEEAIGIATMRTPVEFKMMGSPDVLLKPKILFVLAVTDAPGHLSMLERLMELFRDEAALAACYACTTVDELYEFMAPRI